MIYRNLRSWHVDLEDNICIHIFHMYNIFEGFKGLHMLPVLKILREGYPSF